MRIQATDNSATPVQHGYGNLVVTIVDVNDFAPTFPEPWSDANPYITINIAEGQANGTIVHKFVASDADSNIESFEIMPKNPYFYVEAGLFESVTFSCIHYPFLSLSLSLSLSLIA